MLAGGSTVLPPIGACHWRENGTALPMPKTGTASRRRFGTAASNSAQSRLALLPTMTNSISNPLPRYGKNFSVAWCTAANVAVGELSASPNAAAAFSILKRIVGRLGRGDVDCLAVADERHVQRRRRPRGLSPGPAPIGPPG